MPRRLRDLEVSAHLVKLFACSQLAMAFFELTDDLFRRVTPTLLRHVVAPLNQSRTTTTPTTRVSPQPDSSPKSSQPRRWTSFSFPSPDAIALGPSPPSPMNLINGQNLYRGKRSRLDDGSTLRPIIAKLLLLSIAITRTENKILTAQAERLIQSLLETPNPRTLSLK